MDGTFVVEQGSIADVLALLLRQEHDRTPRIGRCHRGLARYLFRRLQQFNLRSRSRRNVAHHYDLDGRLYRSSSTPTSNIAARISRTPDQSLDDAQLAKKRHLAAKLRVEPGATVLDIGCGWGGLALYLAEIAGAHVTGITLVRGTTRPRATARGRARPERKMRCSASKIIATSQGASIASCRSACSSMSASAFTTLTSASARSFSRRTASSACTRSAAAARPSVTNPWIAKYIFPGGYIPALSEVLPAIQRARLVVTDVEILQLHYAETLKAWRERFLAHREEVERLYDARFVRMWEFYLALSEMAFRESDMVVFQIQMAKRKGVVPQTRDYIGREEARLRTLEAGHRDAAASGRRIVWRRTAAANSGRQVPTYRVARRAAARWVAGKAAMSISHSGRLLDYRRKRSWFADATVAKCSTGLAPSLSDPRC